MKLENTVLLGDCLEVLREIPDETYHAVVTDVPYGLGQKEPTPEEILAYLGGKYLKTGDFMGNDWDIPSVTVWKELYRVLKPGGYVLSFGGCYDEHTEVLTRQGWVRFPDVTGDEEFASLDLETHLVEWQRPKEVVRQPHNGPMYHYRTNKVNLLVTPNHKMVVATMGGKTPSFKLVRADTHGKAVRMTKTCEGRSDVSDPGVFRLPAITQLTSHGHEKEIPEKVIPLEVWLPFFGLWLAEGSATISKNKPQRGHEHGSSYQVAVAHFDIENLREVQRMLSDWFNVRVYPKQGKLRINSKQLALYLRQFGKAWEKFIPDWVKGLPKNRLRVLWDWYMRGDGWGHQRGYTSSPRLRDDWQEVAMYMGISADWSRVKKKKLSKIHGRTITPRRPQYVVRFNHTQNKPEVYDRKGKRNPVRTVIPAESWEGQIVYCVELPKHHTLYVRRNGKAVWCGNTRTWDLISLGLRMAGFENRDTIADFYPSLCWVHGQGMPKSHNVSKAMDKKARASEAKIWKGYGTGLKPCWEPIVVFRKPFLGTVVDNVLLHGTGALNIDGCRVRHSSKKDFEAHKAQVDAVKAKGGVRGDSWKNSSDLSGASDVSEAGRWPPNAVLQHAPGCQKVGEKKVRPSNGSGVAHGRNASPGRVYGSGKGMHSQPKGSETLTYLAENGTETVEAWECVPGCPVAALDEQSGDRPSMLTGRADPNGVHEHPGEDKSSKSTFLGEDREHLSKVYADNGGASRFLPQFEGDTPEGRWPPNAVLAHAPGCRKVGEKKIKPVGCTPSIVHVNDGLFGGEKGRKNESVVCYRDEDGKETVEAWECVEGCPVAALDSGCADAPRFLPQFEGDIPEGRWPSNATLTHHPECMQVGTRKVDAPTINRFKDGAKPFGDGAGHPYTSTQTGDAEGQEDIPVWECVEGCPIKALDEQSGDCPGMPQTTQRKGDSNKGYCGGWGADGAEASPGYGDTGGASRFFEQFQPPDAPFKYVAKPSKRETSIDGQIKNNHPTKKPVELMRWLVKLVTFKGAHILDPYCGSGTTLHAAAEEGVIFTGIERDPEAHETATRRMDIVLGKEQERESQMDAFDLAMELGDDEEDS
jgi:DNA modification methylase